MLLGYLPPLLGFKPGPPTGVDPRPLPIQSTFVCKLLI